MDDDTYAVCLSHCQLVGGITRTLSDDMKIRGDINICLMGDPGWYNSTAIIQHDTQRCRAGYVPSLVYVIDTTCMAMAMVLLPCTCINA